MKAQTKNQTSNPAGYFNMGVLTLYLIQTPFKAFANRAGPDQAALVRAV